jgi:hypothetical protein
MAEKWLDWNKLGPLAEQYHALIAEDVKADTRKIYSTETFLRSLVKSAESAASAGASDGEGKSLRDFVEKRRSFLLNHAEIKKAGL